MVASDWENLENSTEKYEKCTCGDMLKHWKTFCCLMPTSNMGDICSVYDCSNPSVDGAHIKNTSVDGIYIVPMCHSCNKTTNGKFTLKDKTVLVTADYKKSCDPDNKNRSEIKDIVICTHEDHKKAKKDEQKDDGAYFY